MRHILWLCGLGLALRVLGLEGRKVILGIRPEQIQLATTDGADAPSICAEVEVTEPTGPDTLVFVNLNQTKVCCRLAPDMAPQVSSSLALRFEPSRVLLFDTQSGERLLARKRQATDNKVAQLKRG